MASGLGRKGGGGRSGPLLFRKMEEKEERRERGAGLCVPVSSVCMDLNECVSVCFLFERRI